MYELKKKFGKVFTSKLIGTGPSSYEKRIYLAAVSQSLRNTAVELPAFTLTFGSNPATKIIISKKQAMYPVVTIKLSLFLNTTLLRNSIRNINLLAPEFYI